MRTFLKLCIPALLLLAMLFSLSACRGNTPDDTPGSDTLAESVTLAPDGSTAEESETIADGSAAHDGDTTAEEPTSPVETTAPEASSDAAGETPTEPASGESAEQPTEEGEDTPATTDEPAETTVEVTTEAPTEVPTEEPTEAETEPPFSDDMVVLAQRDKLNFSTSITVKQNGGTATVTTPGGLSYTATGYTSVSGNKLTFKDGLKLTLTSDVTAKNFNRFSLGYTSTQPLYGTITYSLNGQAVTDDFYLEAGTDTFSCVISQYLNGKKGTDIIGMTFKTCNGQTAEFALCAMTAQDYPVYGVGADTYYIENDRYKLGIRLIWGGGINYLEDKESPVKRLKNLVNQADTGRLIQQSYYGVQQNAQYTPSKYNGSTWCYNPVQGGDVAQNHSRIIDIVVTDYSVYVKSQPMDWAKDNSITPSYMENTYTVYSDRIQVDNRFVDFSGWTHRSTHQELPAFYTVSYLSRFSLYNGTKPWTNDTMSYRDDLGFWGDSTYYNDCTFLLKNSNTETWCAWTNPDKDFGIGLYVPNVDSYLAGRFSFNNSMESTNGATNYVAPVNTILLKSFEALEYSYLIATGSVEEIRDTFKDNRSFASNAALHKNYQSRRVSDNTVATNEKSYADLNKPAGNNPGTTSIGALLDLTLQGSASHLIPTNNATVAFHSSTQGTALTVTGADPNVTIDYGGVLSADTYKTLEITYMIPTTNSKGNGVTDLFLCAGSVKNPDPNACVRMNLIADGQYHTLTVNLSGKSFWTGDIHKIRFDFFDGCAAGDVMYVKSIVLK